MGQAKLSEIAVKISELQSIKLGIVLLQLIEFKRKMLVRENKWL